MKFKTSETNYFVEAFNTKTKEWETIADEEFSRGEARKNLSVLWCYDRKARLLERKTITRVVAEKDFTGKF